MPHRHTDDAIGHLAERSEHDDRNRRSLPEPAAHLEAVHSWQHQIQDEQVRVAGQCQFESGSSVRCLEDVVTIPGEIAA